MAAARSNIDGPRATRYQSKNSTTTHRTQLDCLAYEEVQENARKSRSFRRCSVFLCRDTNELEQQLETACRSPPLSPSNALNTLLRHEVFGEHGTDVELIESVAARITGKQISVTRRLRTAGSCTRSLRLAAYIHLASSSGGTTPPRTITMMRIVAPEACVQARKQRRGEASGMVALGRLVGGACAAVSAGHR